MCISIGLKYLQTNPMDERIQNIWIILMKFHCVTQLNSQDYRQRFPCDGDRVAAFIVSCLSSLLHDRLYPDCSALTAS